MLGTIFPRQFNQITEWFWAWFLAVGTLGLSSVLIAVGIEKDWAHAMHVFALALLMAGACAVVGWLLGLLFGIPRSLARPASTPTTNTPQTSGATSPNSRVNTNLEDISDWLTKTIVGVGLTQFNSLSQFLSGFAAAVDKNGFNWAPGGQLLALLLLFYFLPGGFWLGYVGTRTVLTKLFDDYASGVSTSDIEKAAAPSNLQPAEDGIKPDPKLSSIDHALLQTPLPALKSVDESVAWASAHARSGDTNTAKVVLQNLLRSNPDSFNIKQNLATLYVTSGEHAAAAPLLRDAPPSPAAVLNALYDNPPNGYQRAIEMGEKLVASPDYAADANLHIWLACAYGQRYGDLKAKGANEADLQAVKAQVVREIKTAINLSPAARNSLHAFWKPGDSIDNDLVAIPPDDPELTALLEPKS